MALRDFLRYIYLKAFVTILRIIVMASGRRRRIEALMPRDPRVIRQSVKIPSRDKGRYIKADIYRPATPPSQEGGEEEEPLLPVLVNWHGSGFIMPLFGADAPFCARVAREVGIAVLDADYRKAPETPFPGPVNDVEDVLLWVASQKQKQRFDATRVAVSGFSAGGNLAIVAATKLRKELAGVIDILAVLSFYPLINLAAPPETKQVAAPINPFPAWQLRLFNECYAPDESIRTDPAVSPYFADAADFPRTVALATCSGDVLGPETEELGERLRRENADGRKVSRLVCEGVRHGFNSGVIADGSFEDVRREELYTFATGVLKGVFKS
ncbi:alpha/beta-hydrolase [Nemania serpens]|nr:alpha/beta-hydrolase [Nemania serpens]